jgi:hypothetical protein
MLREQVKKPDGIEEIRLADGVESRDGRERAEIDLHVEKILEPLDMKSSQHVGS